MVQYAQIGNDKINNSSAVLSLSFVVDTYIYQDSGELRDLFWQRIGNVGASTLP